SSRVAITSARDISPFTWAPGPPRGQPSLAHCLPGRHLHEELLERRVLQSNLAQRPAMLDHRPRYLFAYVHAIFGPHRRDGVARFPGGLAVEDLDFAHTGDPIQRGLHIASGTFAFD